MRAALFPGMSNSYDANRASVEAHRGSGQRNAGMFGEHAKASNAGSVSLAEAVPRVPSRAAEDMRTEARLVAGQAAMLEARVRNESLGRTEAEALLEQASRLRTRSRQLESELLFVDRERDEIRSAAGS